MRTSSTRRTRGNAAMGGITRRGPSYRFTVYLGKKPDGSQLRRYQTWRPPEGISWQEADRLAAEAYSRFRKQCRGGSAEPLAHFSALYSLYFSAYAPARLKRSTAYHYRCMGDRWILPHFGLHKLSQISTADLSAFLMSHPDKAGAAKLKVILSSIFSFGVQQGYLEKNPCTGALCPTPDKKQTDLLSLEQANRLNGLLQSQLCTESTILYLLLHSGIRTGECLGLQWSSIDFDHCVLHIRGTLSTCESGPYFSTPKTKNSQRSLRLAPSVFERLQLHRQQQKQQMQQAEAWKCPDLVFTNAHGDYFSRTRLRCYFSALQQAHNLPPCTLHGLRHTFATLMLESGVHIKAVSTMLGHSSVSVTGDIYSHTLAAYEARAAEAMALLLE